MLVGAVLGGAAALLSGQQAVAQFSDVAESEVRLAQSATIVDIAAGNDNFETLVQALQTAELVDTLAGEGPFTVFAPTDDAFAELPDGAVEALLQPENRDLLVDILTYHVVSGEVPSSAVTSGPVPTLSEDSLTVAVGDTITVDGATVIQPDIEASNGIIHVIDAVLVPDSAISELQALLQPAPAASQPAASEPVRGLW